MKNTLDTHVVTYKGGSIYDFDNKVILNLYPQRIVSNTKNASSILELGLGHGFTTNVFSGHFAKHVVLEGSPAVIQNFKEKFPKCDADIVETFFEDFDTHEKFDVIVMGFILEHVDEPYDIITRYKKFLSPGGKMFLAVPNAESLNRRLGHLAGMLEDIKMLSENDHLSGHKRFYTVDTLTEEIERAGYKINNIEGIYLKPLTTNQILSLDLDKKIIEALCTVGVNYPELSCGILAEISAN